MRKHLVQRAAEEAEPIELDAQTLWREAFGPKTAAWLINKHRRQLHKSGAVDFTLKESIWKRLSQPHQKLYWLALAFETLERRPGWSLIRKAHRGVITWRLRWHAWLERARHKPLLLKDIKKAQQTLEKANLPPTVCSGCGASYYVATNNGFTQGPVKIAVCEECRKETGF